MHCPTCDRTSSNRRVCPHCFTPYPTDDGTPSLRRIPTPLSQPAQGGASVGAGAGAGTRVGASGAASPRSSLSPTVRWTALGIVLVLAAWLVLPGEPAGRASGDAASVAVARARPTMSLTEAQAILRQTREAALVESQPDQVYVSYRAATFPLKEEGQLALAERYAQADEVVEGRRRRIYFYNPNGRVFAQSDPVKGIVVP